MKKPRASPRGAPVTLLGRLSSRATFSSLVSMARPGRGEIVRQFYAGSGRGQGVSQGSGSSPQLESSCPKPSPAGQARPATSIHTYAPKGQAFFFAPPPRRIDRFYAPAAAKISADRQDRRVRQENPKEDGHTCGSRCTLEQLATARVPRPSPRLHHVRAPRPPAALPPPWAAPRTVCPLSTLGRARRRSTSR
eukprot:scaffold84750_cov50-Phaeocystis_antarctica.AAC.2